MLASCKDQANHNTSAGSGAQRTTANVSFTDTRTQTHTHTHTHTHCSPPPLLLRTRWDAGSSVGAAAVVALDDARAITGERFFGDEDELEPAVLALPSPCSCF